MLRTGCSLPVALHPGISPRRSYFQLLALQCRPDQGLSPCCRALSGAIGTGRYPAQLVHAVGVAVGIVSGGGGRAVGVSRVGEPVQGLVRVARDAAQRVNRGLLLHRANAKPAEVSVRLPIVETLFSFPIVPFALKSLNSHTRTT